MICRVLKCRLPLAAGNCEVVNALRSFRRDQARSVVYFVDLPETLAVQDYLGRLVSSRPTAMSLSVRIDEVLENADIRRVSCFDLEEQGISTGFRSDVTREDPGQPRNGAQVSSRGEAAVLVVFGANKRWRRAVAATLEAFKTLNSGDCWSVISSHTYDIAGIWIGIAILEELASQTRRFGLF